MIRRWRGERCEVRRAELVRGLFRVAFGVDEGRGSEEERDYWCFCTGEWRRRDVWRFCTLCDQCRDVREWHCGCGGVNKGRVCGECGEAKREG
jgi:hypothetical protein